MSTESQTSCHFGHLLLVSNHRSMTIVSEKSTVLPFSHCMSMGKRFRAHGQIAPKRII